ncbi:MAG: SH3 domain-containing protein [Oscillospiraceae bacterium]
MNTEKSSKNPLPAILTAISVMCLMAAAIIYFKPDNSSTSQPSAELPAETVSETKAETLTTSCSETTTVSTDTSTVETTTEATESLRPAYENNISHTFGRVNTESDSLNVRKEPNTDSEIIDTLEKGSMVYIYEETDGWYMIETRFEERAYVSADFIKVSEYTGSWKDKYKQIAADIYEYSGPIRLGNNNLEFYLQDFDDDNIPEMIYNYHDTIGNANSYLQIYSADENSLYIDKRRFGIINYCENKSYNPETNEIFIPREHRGNNNIVVSYSDGNVLEKSFYSSNNRFAQDDPDTCIYMIDEKNVSKSEYQKQFNEHLGTSELEQYEYDEFISKLDSMN